MEEALDLSSDRILNNNNNIKIFISLFTQLPLTTFLLGRMFTKYFACKKKDMILFNKMRLPDIYKHLLYNVNGGMLC